MAAQDEKKKDDLSGGRTVDIHYIKTEGYRSYHVDGLFGGLTPNGLLYMELFLERAATPQIVKHKVAPDGTLGDELERIGKKGVIREIEAGLIMHIGAAKIIRDWLDVRIKELEGINKTMMERGTIQ